MERGGAVKVCRTEDPLKVFQLLLFSFPGGEGHRHVQIVVDLYSKIRVIPAEREAGNGAEK